MLNFAFFPFDRFTFPASLLDGSCLLKSITIPPVKIWYAAEKAFIPYAVYDHAFDPINTAQIQAATHLQRILIFLW